MTELSSQLRDRVAAARHSLMEARRTGDDYLVDVVLGELEELRRVARENGVDIPGLQGYAA